MREQVRIWFFLLISAAHHAGAKKGEEQNAETTSSSIFLLRLPQPPPCWVLIHNQSIFDFPVGADTLASLAVIEREEFGFRYSCPLSFLRFSSQDTSY